MLSDRPVTVDAIIPAEGGAAMGLKHGLDGCYTSACTCTHMYAHTHILHGSIYEYTFVLYEVYTT